MHKFGSVVSVVGFQNISKREKMVFSLYEWPCLFISVAILVIRKGLRQQRVYPKVCHFLLDLRCQWKMKRFSSPECSWMVFLNLPPPQKKEKTNMLLVSATWWFETESSHLLGINCPRHQDVPNGKWPLYNVSCISITVFPWKVRFDLMFGHFSGSMVGKWATSGQPKSDINLACWRFNLPFAVEVSKTYCNVILLRRSHRKCFLHLGLSTKNILASHGKSDSWFLHQVLNLALIAHPGKLTWQWKMTSLTGHTSSNGWFSISMLLFLFIYIHIIWCHLYFQDSRYCLLENLRKMTPNDDESRQSTMIHNDLVRTCSVVTSMLGKNSQNPPFSTNVGPKLNEKKKTQYQKRERERKQQFFEIYESLKDARQAAKTKELQFWSSTNGISNFPKKNPSRSFKNHGQKGSDGSGMVSDGLS